MNHIIKIMTIAWIAVGCGQVQYYIEREPDPDTVEAIKKANMAQIEGDWLFAENQGYIYLSFHGDEYNAVLKDGDRVLASDSGQILHEKPGIILFKTHLSGCSAEKDEFVEMQFDRNEKTLLRIVDRDAPWAFRLNRSEPQDIPRDAICLWDNTEKGKLRLKK